MTNHEIFDKQTTVFKLLGSERDQQACCCAIGWVLDKAGSLFLLALLMGNHWNKTIDFIFDFIDGQAQTTERQN